MNPPPDGRRERQRRISLTVTLTTGGRRIPGRLRQLSAKGCRASFELEQLSDLEGDVVELEFNGLLLLEPLCVEASITGRTEVHERALLALEFTDPETVQREVPYVLLVEFTRRAAPRVPIGGEVDVELHMPGLDGHATLVELSSGGVGLHVPPLLAHRIDLDDELDLKFRLPEQEVEFRMHGIVRALHPQDGGVGCSIQFDEAGSENFALQTELLGSLVDRRLETSRTLNDEREAG